MLVPTRLWECVVEKSTNRDLEPKTPHDAAEALLILLDNLVADVRQARAGDRVWIDTWLAHMSTCWYETRVCRGRACTAAGVRPTCQRLDGELPFVGTELVPCDNGATTDLLTLLAQSAVPERHGFDPICNGVSCERCAPTGVRCPCAAQGCAGKEAAHALQPYQTRGEGGA